MKKMDLFFALAAPLCVFALEGCVPAAIGVAAGVGVYSAYDRRTTGAQVDDEGIELRVSNRISERYGDKVHVNVTSYNRVVMLTGEVPNEAIRDELDKASVGLAGVRGVTNEVQVGPHTAYSARANDSAITGKVKARFVDANRFNAIH